MNALPERMQLAVEAGACRIVIPSADKCDVADAPDAIPTEIQWQFFRRSHQDGHHGFGDG